ncbi:ATP-binding cassette domain-containing protein [Microbacterium invictum]|uniref:ABC-2 type transport system ATP-binding protein n=1 Tax=Microbacterium invictum TaxID=515415 RepID=A0AA40SLF1_9MICO|nr:MULTISPECIES: ATP-binding cassette domain-containing protein [Microbacterium]MBB4138264.1 ABC-2 type transport system ATP-binding protein [Microbacterium invictum]
MDAAIDVRGLRKSYGPHTVLDRLDMTVSRGEVFALLGQNGAGKSTTINILTTLESADGGTAVICGDDVARAPGRVKQRISLTGQSAAVDDVLTGTENLVMMGRLRGLSTRSARRRASELLEQFDLADAARGRVGTYSGGMRRRLDLALSFVATPEVLFLDEPTTGLDTRSRRELWNVIRALAGGGTTVFLTTQYLEEADQLADRIAVLHGGRIVAEGTATELKARVGGETLEVHGEDGEVHAVHPTDGTAAGIRSVLSSLSPDSAAAQITLRRPTLDDVFLALTGDAPTPDTRMKEIA